MEMGGKTYQGLDLFSYLCLVLGEYHLAVMFDHVQADARESAGVVGVRCHVVGNWGLVVWIMLVAVINKERKQQ